jgi:hypothetical protein
MDEVLKEALAQSPFEPAKKEKMVKKRLPGTAARPLA